MPIVTEVFERLICLNKQPDAKKEKEASEAISSYHIWDIINLVRLLFKRTNIGGSKAFKLYKKTWLANLKCTDGIDITLAQGRFDEFYIVDESSWLVRLVQSCPNLHTEIRIDKYFSVFSIDRSGGVLMFEKASFAEFAFSVCLNQLLQRYKIKSQNDLIRLEILARLSALEKQECKFSKLYSKKLEESVILFDLSEVNNRLVEDYLYQRGNNMLKSTNVAGKPVPINFFSVYQTYCILQRNPRSEQRVAALLRQNCLANKNSRVFFLMEDIDGKIKQGSLTDAYFILQDLHYYCEHHQVEVPRSTADWLSMKEAFVLLIARCMVDDSPCSYNRPEGIRLSSYFTAELVGLDWIVKAKDGKYYLNKAGVLTDGMHEILLNYQQKLIDLLTPISKTLTQLIPDLNNFLWDVIDNASEPSTIFAESLVLVPVADLNTVAE